MDKLQRVSVIGGCGHVGLPIAILSAKTGSPTVVYDINTRAIEEIRKGKMPFIEEGAEPLLKEVLASEMLTLTNQPDSIRNADIVILIVGTPVDEYLNPRINSVFSALEPCLPYFKNGQTLILRSTIYPGVSAKIQAYLKEKGLDVDIAFCPERIAQGFAMTELRELPQIISAFSARGLENARKFFSRIAPKIIELNPLEAELSKLFANCYRYINFAIANQFYMIAESEGADYHRIHQAMTHEYPRLAHIPTPGLVAGPCLLKDTMQLAAFYHHHFSLGLSSVWINEGLPNFMVGQLKAKHSLKDKTVGILGMAFKANNDDKRDSLAYKLKKLLALEARETICHDPYVKDESLLPLKVVLERSDILIVGAPHRDYIGLQIPPNKVVFDIWNSISNKLSPL